MREDWIIVGISGVTCAGKTTVTKALQSIFRNASSLFQDLYFHPIDHKNHVYIEALKHNNWELLTAVDFDKLWNDIHTLLERPRESDNAKNILLLDGFLILNDKNIADLCDLKYYLKLNKDECWARRKNRSYDPPDVPGYFENVVWPEHLKSYEQMLKINEDVIEIDGTSNTESILNRISQDINCKLKS